MIVQEQMGIALFDEGMVETILDVRDRCLKPGGRILPAKFEFYLEPVQLLEQERIPLIQEQRTHGLTFPRTPTAAGKRLLLPRDKSQRCRVFALRPRTGVHLRPYHVDARPDSEAILSEQAGHAAGPNSTASACISKQFSMTIFPFPLVLKLSRHIGRCSCTGYLRATTVSAKFLRCRLRLRTCPIIVAGHGRSICKRVPVHAMKPILSATPNRGHRLYRRYSASRETLAAPDHA